MSAPSLNNLAELYASQGRYAEAEPLYKRALAIREKALGPDHPDVGDLAEQPGALYTTQGRYAEAEPLYKRALAIREKALGPDHPDVGTVAQQPGRAVPRPGPLRRGRAALEAPFSAGENVLLIRFDTIASNNPRSSSERGGFRLIRRARHP